MGRIEAGGQAYFCRHMPAAEAGRGVEDWVGDALSRSAGPPPALLFWDGRPLSSDEGRLYLGRGGLDPILMGEKDFSGCVAIAESALRRVAERGGKADFDFGRTAALLARSPGVAALWCAGLTGSVDLTAPGPLSRAQTPGAQSDSVSLVVIVTKAEVSPRHFFAALRGQSLSGQVDVVVMALGLDSTALKQLARTLEGAAAADPRLKIRRYSLSGDVGPAYLANVAVALSASDAVVFADVQCIPVSPNAVQGLANWSLTGDGAAACPRILFDNRLLAAGATLTRAADGVEAVGLWNQLSLSDVLRTAAAPAPWFFAARRSTWLASGGLRGTARRELWTAEFAFAHGPKGRTFLVGSEVVEWIGKAAPASPDATTTAHAHLQPSATTSVRDPQPSDKRVDLGSRFLTAEQDAVEPEAPEAMLFSDLFSSAVETRVLVVADAFGASQSIAFVEGLAEGRRRGTVAVRIIDEAAFPSDGLSLAHSAADAGAAEALVARHIEQTRPTVIVASRLGHAAAWRALRTLSRREGVPIVLHVDDDILDLPAVNGVERYRLARNPRRQQTLRSALVEADLVLAATPALAERLAAYGRRDGVVALEHGAAGAPPAVRSSPANRSSVVIGYMGSASHDHDLAMIVPSLNKILSQFRHVEMVLFGSIAEQPSARLLEGNIRRHEAVKGYAAFRRRLADLDFDIGLAPLRQNSFNRVKTATKWAEYAEAGAAVLASPVGPYIPIAAAGAALTAGPEQWTSCLRRLIDDVAFRDKIVRRADRLLIDQFSWSRLENQVLGALTRAAALRVAA